MILWEFRVVEKVFDWLIVVLYIIIDVEENGVWIWIFFLKKILNYRLFMFVNDCL